MKAIPIFLFLVLAEFLSAGVERFLTPIDLHTGTPKSYQKKNAFFNDQGITNRTAQMITTGSSSVISSQDIEGMISDSIKHRFQANGEIIAKLSTKWSSLNVQNKPILKITEISPDELSPSSFIRFSLWDAGIKLGDFSFPFRVAQMRNVYVTEKSIQRGMKLNKEDFTSQRVDVLKQHANSVPYSTNLSGFQLDSNVGANSPLKWNNLSKATLIRKGQVIDVYASGRGIYVTMKGVALEDGALESVVKVKNLSSDKVFHAKVLNQSSVKVHL